MKKFGVFFLIFFCLTMTAMMAVHKIREKNRKDLLSSQAQIIGENIEEQFSNYFEQIAFSSIQLNNIRAIKNLSKKELYQFYDEVLKNHPSVLGINKINAQGIIDEVYPVDNNKGALGKTTQSLTELNDPLNIEDVWVSNPFQLYQGMQGFGFYVRTEKLKNDWLAVVITSEGFFKQFIPNALGENFHIVFEESDSQKEYLRSAEISPLVPASTIQVHKFPFYNRNFTITIWPKRQNFSTSMPWLWSLALSFIITALATLAFVWWNKDYESKTRLEELNQLLRLTIHDTSNSLTAIKGYLEIMKDDPDLVPVERLSKHVSFIIDLLDQIKVMKQLTSTTQDWKLSEHTLLQIILEVSDILSDRLKAKKLSLTYNPEQFVNVRLLVNRSLFSHSVIGNLLNNAIKFSPDSTNISIGYHQEDRFHVIEIIDQGQGISLENIFNVKKRKMNTSSPGTRGEEGSGFGLMIVQQVIELHRGKIEFTHSAEGGTIARVFLPLT
jgi:signal transduction histidine kinase